MWGTSQAVEDVVPLFLSQLPGSWDKSIKWSHFDQSKFPFWKRSRSVLCTWPQDWSILALFLCPWINVSLSLSPRDSAAAPVEMCSAWEEFEAAPSNLAQIQHHVMSWWGMGITAAWVLETPHPFLTRKSCSKGKRSWTSPQQELSWSIQHPWAALGKLLVQTGLCQEITGGSNSAFAKPNQYLGMLPVLHLVVSPDSCSSSLVKS